MSAQATALCRHCGRPYQLRKDGRVRLHGPNRSSTRTWAGVYCYGAGLRPLARAGEVI